MKKKKLALILPLALGFTATASHAAVDFSSLTSGLVTQVESAATYVLPVVAALIGIGLILKLIKKWAK